MDYESIAVILGDGRLEFPRVYKGAILPLPRIIASLQENCKHFGAENAVNRKKIN